MRRVKKAYHRIEFDLQQIQGKQSRTTLASLARSPTRGSF